MVIRALQEVLTDKSRSGRYAPWRVHKMSNEMTAIAYDEVDPRKAERLRNCATRLEFAVDADGRKHLRTGNFCRVRLCPVCQWRRSLKCYAHMAAIMAYLREHYNYAYLFVTLTVRNVTLDKLGDTITDTMAGWHRLLRYKDIQRAVKGWYRGYEVTHNLDPSSPSYDTYHPHIHVVMAVNASYFTGREYISRARMVEMWRKAARLDYDPQVDMRRVKGDTARAIAEVSKYAVKSRDYIIPEDWDLTVETVAGLDRALDNRRFVAYGGAMAVAHKALHLDDSETGDLVHLTGEEADAVGAVRVSYAWDTGYQQYIRVE